MMWEIAYADGAADEFEATHTATTAKQAAELMFSAAGSASP
jgi:uncharacterized tellurite resistance protein B-like protein